MTYCVGILVREGLVMIADTRTNAGRRQHRHLPQAPPVRGRRASGCIGIATAGNLVRHPVGAELAAARASRIRRRGEVETPR